MGCGVGCVGWAGWRAGWVSYMRPQERVKGCCEKVIGIWARWKSSGIGENGFLKLNMTGYEDGLRGEVEAFIASVVWWIAEENHRFGAIGEFVNRGGGE